MVHYFFFLSFFLYLQWFKLWTFEMKFEVFLKSPQMNTICGPQLPAPHWPCLCCTGLTPHISLLCPCSIFMNYPCICGCTSIYSISFYLASTEKDVLSAYCGHFLYPTSPFSQSFFLCRLLLMMFFITFSVWQSISCPVLRNVSLSLTHPVEIL